MVFTVGGYGLTLALFPNGAVRFDETFELLRFGQGDEVAGDEELLVEPGGGVGDTGLFFVGAEDESDGGLIAGLHDLVLPAVQVEIHLSGVAMLEGSGLEIDEQMAAEDAVIKDEIDVIVFVADGEPLLPGLETEASAEFEEEGLQVIEQRFLQVLFEIVRLPCEAHKLQHVGIGDEFGNVRRCVERMMAGVFQDGLLVGGETGALIEQ